MARRRGGRTLPALLLAVSVTVWWTGCLAAVARHARQPAGEPTLALTVGGAVTTTTISATPAPGVPAAAPSATASESAREETARAAPSPAASAPAVRAPAGTPGAPISSAGVVWAVVVGIDDYPGTRRDLHQAVADADAMTAALHGMGVAPERVAALRNGEATAAAITAALDWLRASVGPTDTAVVFYAGHVRKLGSRTEAVLAADQVVVRDTKLAQHLAGMAARDAWIVIAACYGGGFTELLAPGRVLTAAADADTLSYESNDHPYSYLVEYAIHQPLGQGRTPPIVQDAVAFGWGELNRAYPDRQLTSVDEAGHPILLDRSWTPPREPTPPTPEPPVPSPPRPRCTGLLALLCGG